MTPRLRDSNRDMGRLAPVTPPGQEYRRIRGGPFTNVGAM